MYCFSLWLIPCLALLSIIILASQKCHYPQYSPNLKYSQTGVKEIKRVQISQNTSEQDYILTNLTASITFATSLTASQFSYAAILRNLYDINPQNGLSIHIKVSSITNTSLNLQINAHYYNDITLLTISYLVIVKDQQIQQNILISFEQNKYENSQVISNASQTVYYGFINPLINTDVVIIGWLSGISIQMIDSTIQLVTRITLHDNFILIFRLQTYRASEAVLNKVSHTVIVYNPTGLKGTKIKLQIISGTLNLSPLNSNKIQLQAKQFNMLLGILSFAYRTSDFSAFGFEITYKPAHIQFFYTSYYNEVPYLIIKSFYCAHQYQYYYAAANRCFDNCPHPAVNNDVELVCDGNITVDSSDCQVTVEDTWVKIFAIAFSISFAICFAIGAYFIYKKCNCGKKDIENQGQDEMGNQIKKDDLQTATKLKDQAKNRAEQHVEQIIGNFSSQKKLSSYNQLKRLSSSDHLTPFSIPNIKSTTKQNPIVESEKDESIQNIV